MTCCDCEHTENHCRFCGQHFVVVVLRTDHEADCLARPVREVA